MERRDAASFFQLARRIKALDKVGSGEPCLPRHPPRGGAFHMNVLEWQGARMVIENQPHPRFEVGLTGRALCIWPEEEGGGGLLDAAVVAAAGELVAAAAAEGKAEPTVRQARAHFRNGMGLSLTNREISRALRRATEELNASVSK